MMDLSPTTKLQRLPEFSVDLDSSSHICIKTNGQVITCGAHGLTVLDVFSQPTSITDALRQLAARVSGPQDWIDLTSTILELYKLGILRDPTRTVSILSSQQTGYDAAPIHVAMLNDKQRVSRYLEAIQQIVRPGDVVVDIGTGTGILAVAAARAGARRVYAVEASSIAKVAESIFEVNGVTDRVTFIPGWSTQIDLPERADVLVSELIGNEPLGELALEATADAVKRLLKPDARLVPSGLKIMGIPVTIPEDELNKRTFTSQSLQKWQSRYGIDFSPLSEVVQASPHTVFFVKPHRAREWVTLSEPAELTAIDFKATQRTVIEKTTAVLASTTGQLSGILTYFDLELAPRSWLSTHPTQADHDCHWRLPVWLMPAPLSVESGDEFLVRYAYRGPGTQSRVTVSPPRRAST